MTKDKFKILVVDDDPAIIKFLRANLQAEGYDTFAARDGVEALRLVEKELPDLLILDLVLPEIDGTEVCRRLREWSQVPIVMLSARGGDQDKVTCLDLGADDYISKPFSVEELLARIRAVLRRTSSAETASAETSFSCGSLEISFVDRRVTVSGRELRLTPTEYNLLRELVLNANKVLTHQILLHRIWGPEYVDEREYLRVFIGRLRKGLGEDPENPRHVVTVPGVGYQFRTDV